VWKRFHDEFLSGARRLLCAPAPTFPQLRNISYRTGFPQTFGLPLRAAALREASEFRGAAFQATHIVFGASRFQSLGFAGCLAGC
jgi:hypothetical protein